MMYKYEIESNDDDCVESYCNNCGCRSIGHIKVVRTCDDYPDETMGYIVLCKFCCLDLISQVKNLISLSEI